MELSDDLEALDERLLKLTAVGDFRNKAKRLIITAFTQCLGLPYTPSLVYCEREAGGQLVLFAQGRKFVGCERCRKKGPVKSFDDCPHTQHYKAWVDVPDERRVTWALPQDSPHCYAAAIDLALIWRSTRAWLPDAHPAWERMAQWAEDFGLESGHRWPKPKRDSAHSQLKRWRALAEAGELPLIG